MKDCRAAKVKRPVRALAHLLHGDDESMFGRRLLALGCRVNGLLGLRSGAVALGLVVAMWLLTGPLPAVAVVIKGGLAFKLPPP